MSIRIEDLPEWIKNSEFVKEFILDFPGEEITINPTRIFELRYKSSARPRFYLTSDYIYDVLENIRYFGIQDDELFYFIYKIICDNDWGYVLEDFPEFKELNENFNYMMAYKEFNRDTLRLAASKGHLYAFRYLMKFQEDTMIISNAIGSKNLKLVKYLHSMGWIVDEDALKTAISFSWKENDSIEIVRFLFSIGIDTISDENIVKYTIKSRNLQVLKFLYNEKQVEYSTDEYLFAIKYNHIHILKYFDENNYAIPSFEKQLIEISNSHNIDMIKYICDDKKLPDDILYKTVLHGDVGFVGYLFERGVSMVNQEASNLASRLHKRHILNYLLSKGAPIPE